jgi:hypothetical protein
MGETCFPWKMISPGVEPQEDIANAKVRRKLAAAKLVESHAGGAVDCCWS